MLSADHTDPERKPSEAGKKALGSGRALKASMVLEPVAPPERPRPHRGIEADSLQG